MMRPTNIALFSFIALLAVVLLVMFVWSFFTAPPEGINPNPPPPLTPPPTQNPPPSTQEGITITSLQPGDTVTSPLRITGTVNGNGWTGFEGQVGIVELKDNATNNVLASGILTATTDWMQLPTSFEVTLWYSYQGNGSGTLVFHNENASGEPARDRVFNMPVKLVTTSGNKITLRAYFNNSQMDPEYSCQKVFAVNRDVPKTQAVARAALDTLLTGPTQLERSAGFFTVINPGTKIQSLVIQNGNAKVDFNSELTRGVAGSCKVLAIRSEIAQTLMQFQTVQQVTISVNGSTNILQP